MCSAAFSQMLLVLENQTYYKMFAFNFRSIVTFFSESWLATDNVDSVKKHGCSATSYILRGDLKQSVLPYSLSFFPLYTMRLDQFENFIFSHAYSSFSRPERCMRSLGETPWHMHLIIKSTFMLKLVRPGILMCYEIRCSQCIVFLNEEFQFRIILLAWSWDIPVSLSMIGLSLTQRLRWIAAWSMLLVLVLSLRCFFWHLMRLATVNGA